MKSINTIILAFFLISNLTTAQDTLYIYKSGSVVTKRAICDIDSMTFYKTLPLSTVADIDGNIYHTVTIGTQTWMVENLKTTKFNDGVSIPNVTDASVWTALSTPSYCFYYNDVANKNKYGALYNWYAVNTGKLAPKGWHVPTDAELTTLENYLVTNGYNYDGTTTDNKIAKSLAATSGWPTSTITGTIGNDLTNNNTSGFTALPGGYRNKDGTFFSIGYYGYWWSSTEYSNQYAWYGHLYYNYNYLYRNVNSESCGFSIRCLRDDNTSILGAPILSTTAVNNITITSATCGGTITSNGGAPITVSGVCWSTSTTPTTANSKTTDGTTSGSFTSSLIGLTSGTTYYVRAYATNSVGTAYGNEISFTTLHLVVNTTNMIAYFPFDGNAIESISSLTPSSQPNVTYVNGRKGKAYQGANGACLQYLLPTTSKLKTLKSFTVAMWFKSPLVTGDPEPIIMQIGKSDDLYWGNMTLGLNRLSATAVSLQIKAFFLKSGAEWSGQHISYSNTIFQVNQWMHLVFEYDGATSKYMIFKDGVKVVTSLGVEDRKANSAGDALGNLNFVNADVFNIGSWRPKSEGTAIDAWMGWFMGNIDELRIYENALTEIEVKDLYDAEVALTN